MTTTVDWFRVITDLQRAGFDHAQLAKEVCVTRRTIGNWADGVCEPKYSAGAALLEIHHSVMGST